MGEPAQSVRPPDHGAPRRRWVPVLIVVLMAALAIAIALVLRAQWLADAHR